MTKIGKSQDVFIDTSDIPNDDVIEKDMARPYSKWGGDLPDYANMSSLNTAFKMWKDVPANRGAVKARKNGSVARGFTIKTTTPNDDEAANGRVANVDRDFRDPRNGFLITLHEAAQNLAVYNTVVLETKNKRLEGGFVYCLDRRFCSFDYNASRTKVTRVIYKVNPDKPIIYEEGQFVVASIDGFGSTVGGISDFESLVDSSNNWNVAQKLNNKQMSKGGNPPLVFSLKDGGWDEYNKLKAILKNSKAGSNLLLKGDINVTKIGNLLKDMEYQNTIDNSIQDIMTATQTPSIMMAMKAGSQGETNREYMNAFSTYIDVFQEVLEYAFQRAIINIYGKNYTDIYLHLRPFIDNRQKAAVDKTYGGLGAITPNDIRRDTLDLPKINEKWADLPYNQNLTPTVLMQIAYEEELARINQSKQPQNNPNQPQQTPSDPAQNTGNDGNQKPSGQDRTQNNLMMELMMEIRNLKQMVEELQNAND